MAVSRRGLIVGAMAALAVPAAAACGREPGAQEPGAQEPGAREQGTAIVDLERRYRARIGVVATDLVSGASVRHRSDDAFALCSTFKTYAAGRVLQLVDAGKLALDTGVFVDPAEIVVNSPVTEKHAGGSMTLAQLCQAALQRSDNTAGNLLLRSIDGPAGLTAFARSIGDRRTRLDRWEPELNEAAPGDPRDTSTPAALADGYRALLTGEVLTAPRRELLLGWMRANQTSSMRAGLPAGWTSADKTGGGSYGSTNDVGLVVGPDGRRVLLSVMIRSADDDRDAPGFRPVVRQVAAAVLAELS